MGNYWDLLHVALHNAVIIVATIFVHIQFFEKATNKILALHDAASFCKDGKPIALAAFKCFSFR